MALLASMLFVLFNAYIETCESIVGGQPVPASPYPFIAYLNITLTNGDTSYCAASLLRKESQLQAVLLTAASCVDDASISSVDVIFEANIPNDPNGIKQTVESIQVHPNWDGTATNGYNIALLFIDEELNQYQQLTNVHITSLPFDTSECCITGDDTYVLGYGADFIDNHEQTPTLEYVEVEYLSQDECQNGESQRYQAGQITNTMICADSQDQTAGPCVGDAGAPLIIKGTNEQIGISSWSYSCGDHPSVYTNIGTPDIYNWIQEEMKYVHLG